MKYQLSFCTKNMISSHEKIMCMLSLHVKYHCCYGYIINHAFHSKQLFQCNALVFRVEKIFLLFAALTCEISWLSTLKEKFCIMISVQPCNILYISKNSQSTISQKYQLFILKQAGEGSSITDSSTVVILCFQLYLSSSNF